MWKNYPKTVWAKLLEECGNYHDKASQRHFVNTGEINPDIPLKILLRILPDAPSGSIYENKLWDRITELQEKELKKTRPTNGE